MKCGIYDRILGKSSPEKEFVVMAEQPEPVFRAKDVLVALGVVVLFLIFVFVMTNNNSKDDSVYGVKDWSVQCGKMGNQDLSFNYAVFKDNDQLVCIFDNSVESHVLQDDGSYITNPVYKVCYRMFHLDQENGGWILDGQTC